MPETFAGIAKSRNVRANGAAGRGFLAQVLLNDVIAMDTILRAQVEVKIGRTLVKVHIGNSASGETCPVRLSG